MTEYRMCRLAAAAGVSAMAGCGLLIDIRDLPDAAGSDASTESSPLDAEETGNSEDAEGALAEADGVLASPDAGLEDLYATVDVDSASLAQTVSEAAADTSNSTCDETYANDGASKTTVGCQTGDCVAGQQVCCYRSGQPDTCVGGAQCDGLPIACLSQSHCAYAGPDMVCCLVLDDAGAPTAARCTTSGCCVGASAAVLCGDPSGTCPNGSTCNATITAAGSVFARCN